MYLYKVLKLKLSELMNHETESQFFDVPLKKQYKIFFLSKLNLSPRLKKPSYDYDLLKKTINLFIL